MKYYDRYIINKFYLNMILFLVCGFFWSFPLNTTAANTTLSENSTVSDVTEELLHGYDFSAENDAISIYFPDLNMTMEEMLVNIMKEGYLFSPADLVGMLLDQTGRELKAFRNLFLMICLCSILSALAQNLVGIYENRQALQLGFYIIYLVLALYLSEAFVSCSNLARQSLKAITEFLNVFLPAYYFTVGISVGPTSSTGFYSLSMIAVYLVEYVLYLILIPAVSIYFLLALSSCAAPGDRMSSLLQMVKKGISLGMKICMTLVGSLGAIRMLILPAADGVSYGTAKKFLSVLPGIGTVNDITLQIAGGSLLLIKNGIGIVIMILLVMLAAVPLLRMLVVAFILRLGGAVSHMVAGEGLSRLTERASSAVMMLIKITGCGYVLNLLVLGIVAACK